VLLTTAVGDWLRQQIETRLQSPVSLADKKAAHERLVRAHAFEAFLAEKMKTEKRFGLEGCDSLIPSLGTILDEAGDRGVSHAVLGMAHRGRLNVLANILHKPAAVMLREFNLEKSDLEYVGSVGDVKYHKGAKGVHSSVSGKSVHVELLPNPSHLEAVNPFVMGKARALQDQLGGDSARSRVLPILVHGDAAFAGQGVVFESIGFAELDHFKVGGTIHVVANNQIGFTTDPSASRSSLYCTEIAKVCLTHSHAYTRKYSLTQTLCLSVSLSLSLCLSVCLSLCLSLSLSLFLFLGLSVSISLSVSLSLSLSLYCVHHSCCPQTVGAPVFHVNGDDPESIVRVARLVSEYRQTFGGDVVLDIIAYRLNGHNEVDDPTFTQPVMYKIIKKHPRIALQYASDLVKSGVLSQAEADKIMADYRAHLQTAYAESKKADVLATYYKKESSAGSLFPLETGVDLAFLKHAGAVSGSVPANFRPHDRILQVLNGRKQSVVDNTGVDWATAEALAFASILATGHTVRISGQDVERGTFSHRHSVIHDFTTGAVHVPLRHVAEQQAEYHVGNSSLTEFGALGYESGYSYASKVRASVMRVVLWCSRSFS
jgi:2-oxoglutarate dehydrogenase E1 component